MKTINRAVRAGVLYKNDKRQKIALFYEKVKQVSILSAYDLKPGESFNLSKGVGCRYLIFLPIFLVSMFGCLT